MKRFKQRNLIGKGYRTGLLQPLTLFLCLIQLSLSAATLFQDNFSDELYSRMGWLVSSQDDSSLSFSSQGMMLTNSQTYNSMIALHTMSIKPSEFSISASIVKGSPASGIFFNVNRNNSGSYNGYAAVVTLGKVEVIKFINGSSVIIASHATPFVKSTCNTLSINRQKENIMVFCNGYYLYTVKDSDYSSGDCALMVQPRSSAVFRHFEVNSQIIDTLHFPDFIDNFDNNTSFGWRKSGSGDIEVDDSLLKITTGSLQQCTYGVYFPINHFNCKAVFRWDTGSDSSLYGIFLRTLSPANGTSQQIVKLGLNKMGEIKFANVSDSVLVSMKRGSGILKNSSYQEWDTIEIDRWNNALRWSINGVTLIQTSIADEIRGVEVFCGQKLNISIDNFDLKCSELLTEISNSQSKLVPFKSQFSSKTIGKFDILGRSSKDISRKSGFAPVLLIDQLSKRILITN